MRRFTLVLLGCLALASLPLVVVTRTAHRAEALSSQPNIILIVTDDQTMDAMSALTEIDGSWRKFNNAFINNPLCCPSRASILTGQFSHHTGVNKNVDAKKFKDAQTVGTWLQAAGYRTGIVGKYFNNYPFEDITSPAYGEHYRPPGWNKAVIFGSNPKYLPTPEEECRWGESPSPTDGHCPTHSDYILNESTGPTGPLTAVHYDGTKLPDTNGDYSTDVLAQHAKNFISNASGAPFFLYFAPNAPHWPFWPSAAHINDNVTATDMPLLETRANFNVDVAPNGPYWQRMRCQRTAEEPGQPADPSLGKPCPGTETQTPEAQPAYEGTYNPSTPCPSPAMQTQHDWTVHGQQCQHFNAWRTLKSVDDALAGLRYAAEHHPSGNNKWDNTVVIFMTDNGLSMMSHNWHAKSCIYEECIRTPLYIRYPDGTLPEDVPDLVSNVDIAPTIVDIAEGAFNFKRQAILNAMAPQGQTPFSGFDGRSLLPLLQGSTPSNWRKATLIESTGWWTTYCTDPPPFDAVRSDHWVYAAFDLLYEDKDPDVTCPGSSPPANPPPAPPPNNLGSKELYDISENCGPPVPGSCLAVDPDQLINRADRSPQTLMYQRQQRLAACLDYLKTRAAVQWPGTPDEKIGPTEVCRDLTLP